MARTVCMVLLAGAFAFGAAANGKDTGRTDPVRLKSSPAISPGLSALPRIVAARGDRAVQRINQALARSDARVRGLAEDCRNQAGRRNSSWTRSVSVSMPGPRYLGIVATNAWYCGGAHPDAETVPHVFDLRTGAPVAWERLLPMAQTANSESDSTGTVASDVLAELYRKSGKPEAVNPQCKEAVAGSDLTFLLWPDAKQGGVVIQPASLPHVIAACGVPVTIPTATLRPLGVNADLLDAIDAAHRAAN